MQYICPEAIKFGVEIQAQISIQQKFTHWSRIWEYPWVAHNGDFHPGQKILDAGGCNSILPYYLSSLGCDVIIADLDEDMWKYHQETPTHKEIGSGLSFVKADLKKLPFPDNYFDRVVCASVLEHMTDPILAVLELKRVLKQGEGLVMTMDVASFRDYEFHVDKRGAEDILRSLGLNMPTVPIDVVTQYFKEKISPSEESNTRMVGLNVLGLTYTKN